MAAVFVQRKPVLGMTVQIALRRFRLNSGVRSGDNGSRGTNL